MLCKTGVLKTTYLDYMCTFHSTFLKINFFSAFSYMKKKIFITFESKHACLMSCVFFVLFNTVVKESIEQVDQRVILVGQRHIMTYECKVLLFDW